MNTIYWMSSVCTIWDEIIYKKFVPMEKLLNYIINKCILYAKTCPHKCMHKFKGAKQCEKKGILHTDHLT